MDYNKTSENINNRYNRLSEKDSEIKLVKNQEESSSTLQMSEHEMPPAKQEKQEKPEVIPEKVNNNSTIFDLWVKYKFWIIASLILLLLVIVGVSAYFYGEKNSKLNILEKAIEQKKDMLSRTSVMTAIDKMIPKQTNNRINTSPADSVKMSPTSSSFLTSPSATPTIPVPAQVPTAPQVPVAAPKIPTPPVAQAPIAPPKIPVPATIPPVAQAPVTIPSVAQAPVTIPSVAQISTPVKI